MSTGKVNINIHGTINNNSQKVGMLQCQSADVHTCKTRHVWTCGGGRWEQCRRRARCGELCPAGSRCAMAVTGMNSHPPCLPTADLHKRENFRRGVGGPLPTLAVSQELPVGAGWLLRGAWPWGGCRAPTMASHRRWPSTMTMPARMHGQCQLGLVGYKRGDVKLAGSGRASWKEGVRVGYG